MDLSAISKQSLHHAYFLEGDHEYIIPKLLDHLEGEGITSREKAAVSILPVFYIENSRQLTEMQLTVTEEKRVIVIAFDKIIEAAEHALLKTLEEPTANTHFFFINRNSNSLLATVKSRMMIISSNERKDTMELDKVAKDYISSDYYGRGESLKKTLSVARGEDDEDDEEKAVAKRELLRFLDSLERVLADELHKGSHDIATSIIYVLKAKKDMEDASPSLKMIFEHLALKIPRISRL